MADDTQIHANGEGAGVGAPAYPKTQAPLPKGATEGERLSAHELDALRAVRVLEERFVNLRHKAQLTDTNLLATQERLQREVRDITHELVEVRKAIADMREILDSVQGEMKHAASVYEVKALEKYLSYWEPMDFVTQEELARTRNLLKRQGGS